MRTTPSTSDSATECTTAIAILDSEVAHLTGWTLVDTGLFPGTTFWYFGNEYNLSLFSFPRSDSTSVTAVDAGSTLRESTSTAETTWRCLGVAQRYFATILGHGLLSFIISVFWLVRNESFQPWT